MCLPNKRQKLDWEEHQESDKKKNAFKCFFFFNEKEMLTKKIPKIMGT